MEQETTRERATRWERTRCADLVATLIKKRFNADTDTRAMLLDLLRDIDADRHAGLLKSIRRVED